jgi:hypothetical protein
MAAHWFGSLRGVRDGLLYTADHLMVFPQLDRIGFLIHRREFKNPRFDEALMVNENIVDFELYAAAQMGQGIGLIERVCRIILTRTGLTGRGPEGRSGHPPLPVLRAWGERLLSQELPGDDPSPPATGR